MFDLKTVPKVVIKEIQYNDVEILLIPKRPKAYALLNKGVRWCFYDAYTNRELKEMYSSYDLAYGDVLITGFGYGLLASWLDSKPEVKSVTVLENCKDIYDVFLKNNKLPKKVKVIITDASEYKTEEKFDCIFLDHYEQHSTPWVFKDIKRISKNIPNHDLLWAWSLEERYAEVMFGIHNSATDIASTQRPYGGYFDFYSQYENFKKNILSVKTLPNFTKEKLNEYVLTYYDRIGYSTSI